MSKQQKGKLNPEDEQRIQINFELVNTELDGKDLVDRMFQERVFSMDDMEEVRNAMPNIRKRRTEVFLEKLFNSGPNGYTAFLEAVKNAGYTHVADKLESTTLPCQVPEEDWFEKVQASRKVAKVLEKDLIKLVGALGNNWELVALELNVKMAQIEQIKMSGVPVNMQLFNVFNKWRQREAGKATFQAFVKALKACDGKSTIEWDTIKNVVLNGD